jgi:hypothetical protein
VAASQDRGVGAVTFWQFLDRQIGRIRPSGVAGAGIFLLTGAVLWMLYRDRTLADNDLFKTLAQAIVVQGLVGLAMASWFTVKHRAQASGKPDDPVHTEEGNR